MRIIQEQVRRKAHAIRHTRKYSLFIGRQACHSIACLSNTLCAAAGMQKGSVEVWQKDDAQRTDSRDLQLKTYFTVHVTV